MSILGDQQHKVRFELLEGRIHGARYYTVKPEFHWHLEGDWGGIETWRTMMEWMVATFGESAEFGVWEPNARWYADNGKFWFRTEEDRILFLLKWQ
jgi:hypothetical protein